MPILLVLAGGLATYAVVKAIAASYRYIRPLSTDSLYPGAARDYVQSGKHVRLAQLALAQLGYRASASDVWDPATRAAMIAFLQNSPAGSDGAMLVGLLSRYHGRLEAAELGAADQAISMLASYLAQYNPQLLRDLTARIWGAPSTSLPDVPPPNR